MDQLLRAKFSCPSICHGWLQPIFYQKISIHTMPYRILRYTPSGPKYSQHFFFSSRVNPKTQNAHRPFLYSTSVLFVYTIKFDCCLVESYGQKKRQKKVQVWCTSSSNPWNLGMPLTRRHPLVTPKATI